MTVMELKQEFDVSEVVLQECAELIGLAWSEEYPQQQADMLALAVLLKRLGFQPERIRRCCADPGGFPEYLQAELQEGRHDDDQRRLLEMIRDMVVEDWNCDTDSITMWLEEIHILWQMDQSGGAGFATVNLVSIVVIVLISLAAALLLWPVITNLIRPFLDKIL